MNLAFSCKKSSRPASPRGEAIFFLFLGGGGGREAFHFAVWCLECESSFTSLEAIVSHVKCSVQVCVLSRNGNSGTVMKQNLSEQSTVTGSSFAVWEQRARFLFFVSESTIQFSAARRLHVALVSLVFADARMTFVSFVMHM